MSSSRLNHIRLGILVLVGEFMKQDDSFIVFPSLTTPTASATTVVATMIAKGILRHSVFVYQKYNLISNAFTIIVVATATATTTHYQQYLFRQSPTA